MTRTLIEQLKYADDLYYNDVSGMSDTAYDTLKENAKKLYPNDPYFNTVGADVKSEKVQLPFVLGSLKKVKSDTVENWATGKGDIVVSDKMDGISFMATWENHKLVFAATRGNGSEGQDITNKLKYILPEIKIKERISLRGELLLTGDDHLKLGFKNRRNGVAGIIGRDDIYPEQLRMIRPIFYEILDCENIDVMYEDERLQYIEKLGLDVVPYSLVTNPNVETLTEILMEEKQNLIFDIDGLVLTKNDSVRENVLYPENKVAFKVNTDAVDATVTNIEWVLGRTGKVTPIVHIEPIELDGVTVSKATGFNYKFILDNALGIGSKIGIVRSGGVIPYITEVYETFGFDVPTECPSCKGELKLIGVDLVCKNKDCYDSKVRQITHFFKTMGSEFISDTTVTNLGVGSIEEMYELDELEIANIDGFGIKKAEQIVYEIKKTLTTTPDKLLAAFGISGIGKTLSVPILNKYTFDELFTIDSIKDIEGVGEILSDNLINNIGEFYNLYMFLKEKGLTFITKEKTSITGKVFTITGKLPMKRDEIVKMIVAKGGLVKGISKSTDYLITDDPNSGSTKNKKASAYGTAIIGWGEFLELAR